MVSEVRGDVSLKNDYAPKKSNFKRNDFWTMDGLLISSAITIHSLTDGMFYLYIFVEMLLLSNKYEHKFKKTHITNFMKTDNIILLIFNIWYWVKI